MSSRISPSLSDRLDALHARVKANVWLRRFAVFNRIALAAGFLPSGFTKIFGERFTSLSVNHPMGNYLEALYHTGYYYPFIGYVQVTAAILLLIPRTATLGALLYFPIILNICILSLAVGFDGSLISAPLMVYANLYLLGWDYDKLRHILPLSGATAPRGERVPAPADRRFPRAFFLGVLATIALTIAILATAYDKRPRNNHAECVADCQDGPDRQACLDFCACIHKEGKSFDHCARAYKAAKR